MIDRMIVTNFKSFRKLDVCLGRANLLIGENGSGKSNFLDVFRVLRGLSWGLTVKEVFDGKSPDKDFGGWPGIRGASAGACFAPDDGEVMIEVRGTLEPPLSEKWEYLVRLSPQTGSLLRERLKLASAVHYDSAPDHSELNRAANIDSPHDDLVTPDIGVGSILAQVRHELAGVRSGAMFQAPPPQSRASTDGIARVSNIAEQASGVASALADILPLDPSPMVLRQSSQLEGVDRIGDHGENFAALVRSICRIPEYKDSLLWWLQQLLSDQVEDVGTIRDPRGESMFMLRDQSGHIPATVLSDGTLRFAALLGALLQPEKPSMITLDMVEMTIHPNRLRLPYLLLWDESEFHGIQSISTTHSPVMLEWIRENQFATAFVCKKDESTGESRIVPLPEVPHFMECFKKGARTSELLSGSWFEGAL